ncbi:MAG: hypothetical protein LBQ36_03385 [Synergistaceae bacterium]|jgi:flagellin|nr:hypothetical protein [Synergistaceae bacterium]
MKIASGIVASMSGVGVSSFTAKITKSVAKLASGQRNDAAAMANLSAAGSRITDVESARQIIEFTKTNMLSHAESSVSGQANQLQRDIINLIR